MERGGGIETRKGQVAAMKVLVELGADMEANAAGGGDAAAHQAVRRFLFLVSRHVESTFDSKHGC